MQVLEIKSAVCEICCWVQQRIGTFGKHRQPPRQIILGYFTRITEDGAVIVNDRRARSECLERVGGEFFMRPRDIRIVFLGPISIDRCFDDDWSAFHSGDSRPKTTEADPLGRLRSGGGNRGDSLNTIYGLCRGGSAS
ncbi:unannotated protein [freshwater metagenome]|uniref:Unannotated protein n=1 Tax=freshwater metagenome TaxID=449393 RepID=A0A6J7NZ98_9ZZZZ